MVRPPLPSPSLLPSPLLLRSLILFRVRIVPPPLYASSSRQVRCQLPRVQTRPQKHWAGQQLARRQYRAQKQHRQRCQQGPQQQWAKSRGSDLNHKELGSNNRHNFINNNIRPNRHQPDLGWTAVRPNQYLFNGDSIALPLVRPPPSLLPSPLLLRSLILLPIRVRIVPRPLYAPSSRQVRCQRQPHRPLTRARGHDSNHKTTAI